DATVTGVQTCALPIYLVPYFGEMGVGDITSGTVQDYRVHRQTSRKHRKTGKVLRPSRSTLHSEIVTLRQILKMCSRKETIKAVRSEERRVGKEGWWRR